MKWERFKKNKESRIEIKNCAWKLLSKFHRRWRKIKKKWLIWLKFYKKIKKRCILRTILFLSSSIGKMILPQVLIKPNKSGIAVELERNGILSPSSGNTGIHFALESTRSRAKLEMHIHRSNRSIELFATENNFSRKDICTKRNFG